MLELDSETLTQLGGAHTAYDFVVIDEVQDLTPLELASALKVAQSWSSTLPNLFVAGDEGQVVRPTFFEFAELNDLLYQDQYKPATTTLGSNLRSPKVIADCVTRVKVFHRLLLPKYRPADQKHRPSTYETDALLGLYVFEHQDEVSTLLSELTQHPTVQLIDLFEDPQMIRDTLGVDEAMTRHFNTAEDTKGLEFTSVCIVGAAHVIERLDKEYAQDDPIAFRLNVNRLRVAISRAMEHLIFIEPLSAVNEPLRTLIGGEATHEDWTEIPQRTDLGPLATRSDEGMCLSRAEVSEALAPSHLSSDERVQGFLGRAERLFFDEQRYVDALVDLTSASQLAHDGGDLSEDLTQAVYDLIARLALTDALSPLEQRQLEDSAWEGSVILNALDHCGGDGLTRLVHTTLRWSSAAYDIEDLKVWYRALHVPKVRSIPWISRTLSDHRWRLEQALREVATHTDVALIECESVLEILGFDSGERPRVLHGVRRIAFDTLITKDWSEAQTMWSDVESVEREDLMRDAQLYEARGEWEAAAQLYEAHAELGRAFKAYRQAGSLSESGRLMEGRDLDELVSWDVSGLELLTVSMSYLERYPLSVRERAELLRYGDEKIEHLRDELISERELIQAQGDRVARSQRHLDDERLTLDQRADELLKVELELDVREASLSRREQHARKTQYGTIALPTPHLNIQPQASQAPLQISSPSLIPREISPQPEPAEAPSPRIPAASAPPVTTSPPESPLSSPPLSVPPAALMSPESPDELGETLDHIPAVPSLDREVVLSRREHELFIRAQALTQRELKLRRQHNNLGLSRERLDSESEQLRRQRRTLEQQSNRLDYERKRYERELEEFDESRLAHKNLAQKLLKHKDRLSSRDELLAEREADLSRRTQELEELIREAQATRDALNAYERELEQRDERLQRTAKEHIERAQELNELSEALDERNQRESEYFTSVVKELPPDEEESWDPHYTKAMVHVLAPQEESEVILGFTSAPSSIAPPLELTQIPTPEPTPESLLEIPQDSPPDTLLDTSLHSISDPQPGPSSESMVTQDENDTAIDIPALSAADFSPPQEQTSARPQPLSAGDMITDDLEGLPLPLVYCPPGEFTMGSDQGEPGERPRHLVHLSEGFWLGQTPITQRQWAHIMGSTPSRFVHPEHPVERVSWSDAVIFCNRLSVACGLTPVYHVKADTIYRLVVQVNFAASGFRLPTESEWEYAAGAGQDLPFAGGRRARDVAWTSWSSHKQSQPVAQKQPNAWCLYDMSGNVAEWCADIAVNYEQRTHASRDPFYDAPIGYRVIRGGSWACAAHLCRVTSRGSAPPEARGPDIGLRVLRRFDT